MAQRERHNVLYTEGHDANGIMNVDIYLRLGFTLVCVPSITFNHGRPQPYGYIKQSDFKPLSYSPLTNMVFHHCNQRTRVQHSDVLIVRAF